MINHKKFYVILILLLGFLLLVVNCVVGTERIIDAAANEFRGGSCGSRILREEICSKRYGFDLYLLALTPFFWVSLVSFFGTIIIGANLISNLKISFLITICWIIMVELLVRIFQIPVLSRAFLEGRQELRYSFFIFSPALVIIFIGLFITSSIGYFFGSLGRSLKFR